MKVNLIYVSAGILLLGASCGSNSGTRGMGPIILGDSSTIITEKDSQYLKDDVMDIEPRRAAAPDTAVSLPPKKDEPVLPAKDTVATIKKVQEEPGFAVSFGDAKLVFSGLKLKDGRKQNPVQDNGLTYSLHSGNLGSAKVFVYGAKNISIKQRYQTRLTLKSDLGTVDLRDLGLYTSGWNTLPSGNSGNAPHFALSSLNNVTYSQVNNNKIKNALDRELRKHRTNSRTIQSWMKEIKRVRSAGDEPCDIILDNVQWQVSGTDAHGKTFHKNIRIDA